MKDERIEVIFGAQIAQLLAGLGEATAAVRESTEAMSTAFEGMEAAISTAMAPLLAITAILEGGEIFGEAISKAAEFGEQLEIASKKTGMEVEELSALQYAANLSDVSVGELTVGLQRLARGMEEAEKSTGPAFEAFRALGVRATDAEGRLRPMHDVLLDLAARFQSMEDGAGKTALAMDLFGRSGANLIPLLNQGSEGITELEQKARELGVTMGEEGVSEAMRYVRTMKEFHAEMDALERTIAIDVMPVLTTLAKWFESSVGGVTHYADEIFRLVVGFSFIKQMKRDAELQAMLDRAREPTPPPKTAAPDMSSKDTTQMQKWLEELNVRKEAAIKNDEDLKKVELEFWKAKLAIAKEGTEDYIEIHSKIVAIEEEQSREAKDPRRRWPKKPSRSGWTSSTRSRPHSLMRPIKSESPCFRFVIFSASCSRTWSRCRRSLASGCCGTIRRPSSLRRTPRWQSVLVARVAAEAWGALIIIGNHAATAVAAAWASISAIPFVGPFLAPAVAVGTGAAVLALASGVKSAAGGYDVPSGINPMTQLHAQEMVLPADLANRIRGLTGGEGSGGNYGDVHIHAIDAQSFRDFARRNPEGFGDGVAAAISSNHSGLNKALRNRA
jgi:hypothetical protein